ncbi:MAG TPA: hypothetical protein VND23_03825 [Acidimicrobiales bacterium]|nr:hypothetical protein [Acidimicrobiales bacterium]
MTAGGTMPGGAGDATHARPSARRLCDAVPRGRVEVTGVVTATRAHEWPDPVFEADLDDGTGRATLVYLGRRAVPGVAAGARLTVEATLRSRGGRLELLNPRYRFEPGGDA